MGSTNSRLPLRAAGIGLLLLLLAAGVIYSVMLPAQARFSDEQEYLLLSHNLLHGPGYSMDGVHLTASRPPGYAFFISAIEAMGGGIVAIRVIQFALVGATVWLVSLFCPEKSRPGSLLIVTGLVALYAVLFYTASTLYPQTLAAFLFVLMLVFLLKITRNWATDLATGSIFGLLILVVPTFLFTLVVVLAVAWLLKLINWRNAAVIFAVAAIFVGLWTARNYVQFHQFVPVASNSGANFLIGNCENTVPTGGSGNVDRTHYQQEAQRLGLDEFQTDHYYRQAAVTWIEENPVRALVLYGEKVLNFFNFYNQYAPENKGEVSFAKQAVMAVTYGVLIALLLWRLLEAGRFPLTAHEKLFLAVYILSAFTQAIFFTRIRLRLPYDYLIIAIVAIHLCRRLLPPRLFAKSA